MMKRLLITGLLMLACSPALANEAMVKELTDAQDYNTSTIVEKDSTTIDNRAIEARVPTQR